MAKVTEDRLDEIQEALEKKWLKDPTPKNRESLDIVLELQLLREKMHDIRKWTEAYPVEIFREPDMKAAHEALVKDGMTLDVVTASNFRWVLNRLKAEVGIQEEKE